MSKTGDWFLKMQEDAERLDLASWIEIHGESNKWVFEKANEDTPEEITKWMEIKFNFCCYHLRGCISPQELFYFGGGGYEWIIFNDDSYYSYAVRRIVWGYPMNKFKEPRSDKELVKYIKDWLEVNKKNPDETPEGLAEDSANLLQKIEEFEEKLILRWT